MNLESYFVIFFPVFYSCQFVAFITYVSHSFSAYSAQSTKWDIRFFIYVKFDDIFYEQLLAASIIPLVSFVKTYLFIIISPYFFCLSVEFSMHVFLFQNFFFLMSFIFVVFKILLFLRYFLIFTSFQHPLLPSWMYAFSTFFVLCSSFSNSLISIRLLPPYLILLKFL